MVYLTMNQESKRLFIQIIIIYNSFQIIIIFNDNCWWKENHALKNLLNLCMEGCIL